MKQVQDMTLLEIIDHYTPQGIKDILEAHNGMDQKDEHHDPA